MILFTCGSKQGSFNAYFEHRGKPFYAIEYETDSIRGITEYFDENGKNLRRAFSLIPCSI